MFKRSIVSGLIAALALVPLHAAEAPPALRDELVHTTQLLMDALPTGDKTIWEKAVTDDAVRSWSWTPTSAVNGYRYGVYDPIEGVGTPFFAGYYSAGTRDAADGPEPLFGNPMN